MAGKTHEQEEWSDDEPPLLDGEESHAGDSATKVGATSSGDEVSLMDEMVAIATEAKAVKRQQQAKERNTESFGAGLKKGFFNQSKTTKQRKGAGGSSTQPQRLDIREEVAARKKEETFKIVNRATTNQSNNDAELDGSSFVFPEVQDALKSMHKLNPDEWLNEQFFAKMAQNPKLLQALQNPRFTQAINELQQNPQAAVLKYQRDPDVSLMLRDLMEVLGSHFEELGKSQEVQRPVAACDVPSLSPPIVDLDETRLQAIANMKRSPEEEDQVQRILQSPELLAALSDATLMDQLQQCQHDPRALQSLARDPVLGPKLRLLVDAKMVQFV